MENSIAQRQNSDDNLRLHVAKDRLYLDAELFWWGGLLASVIVATGGILVYFTFIPNTIGEQILGVIGGLAGLLLAGQFQKWSEVRRKWAARIQEQSDITLFDLPWNNTLAPEGPLNPDLIIQNAQRSKATKEQFLNWYTTGTAGSLDFNQQVLLCQRESLSFDYLLRSRFARTCYWVLFSVIAAGLLISWCNNPPFQTFLLQITLPLAGFIKFIWDNYASNIQTAKDLEQMETDVRKKLKKLEANPKDISKEDLRDVQDFIFRNRSSGLPVPDLFYKWMRPKIESTIQTGTETITKNN